MNWTGRRDGERRVCRRVLRSGGQSKDFRLVWRRRGQAKPVVRLQRKERKRTLLEYSDVADEPHSAVKFNVAAQVFDDVV